MSLFCHVINEKSWRDTHNADNTHEFDIDYIMSVSFISYVIKKWLGIKLKINCNLRGQIEKENKNKETKLKI